MSTKVFVEEGKYIVDYVIEFDYVRPGDNSKGFKKKEVGNGLTFCIITRVKKPISQWYGESRCSFDDVFCKAKGRKVALADALKSAFKSDANIRRIFWETYFSGGKHRK